MLMLFVQLCDTVNEFAIATKPFWKSKVLIIFIKTYDYSGLEEYYFRHQFTHDLSSKETTGMDRWISAPPALQQGEVGQRAVHCSD